MEGIFKRPTLRLILPFAVLNFDKRKQMVEKEDKNAR